MPPKHCVEQTSEVYICIELIITYYLHSCVCYNASLITQPVPTRDEFWRVCIENCIIFNCGFEIFRFIDLH